MCREYKGRQEQQEQQGGFVGRLAICLKCVNTTLSMHQHINSMCVCTLLFHLSTYSLLSLSSSFLSCANSNASSSCVSCACCVRLTLITPASSTRQLPSLSTTKQSFSSSSSPFSSPFFSSSSFEVFFTDVDRENEVDEYLKESRSVRRLYAMLVLLQIMIKEHQSYLMQHSTLHKTSTVQRKRPLNS